MTKMNIKLQLSLRCLHEIIINHSPKLWLDMMPNLYYNTYNFIKQSYFNWINNGVYCCHCIVYIYIWYFSTLYLFSFLFFQNKWQVNKMVIKHAWITPAGRNFSFCFIDFCILFEIMFLNVNSTSCVYICVFCPMYWNEVFWIFYLLCVSLICIIVPRYGFWIAKQVNEKIII